MVESKQVLEWQQQARIETRRADVRELLEDRFGPLPATVLEKLQAIADPDKLHATFRQALRLRSLQDLQLE